MQLRRGLESLQTLTNLFRTLYLNLCLFFHMLSYVLALLIIHIPKMSHSVSSFLVCFIP